jgi:hypothetical protein
MGRCVVGVARGPRRSGYRERVARIFIRGRRVQIARSAGGELLDRRQVAPLPCCAVLRQTRRGPQRGKPGDWTM